ncbi:MAG: efflux RND transporter periplasmic adaptor subunit [Crocinitomicaceae bacterium]|jgi:RND family efflux transporter MFP subunit|nr:efflux RND transporter periplasmic adaptor subunit [Crocinitomicaceae bacterium]
MNKRVITVGIIIIVLISLTVFQLMKNKNKIAKEIYIHDTSTPILVEDGRAEVHTFDSQFSFLGTFEPNRTNLIGSEGQGKIISLNVQEGQFINQGAILLQLDNDMLQYQLENLDVSIESQTNDLDRLTILAKSEAVPAVQLEKARLALKSSQIQRKQVLKQLSGNVLKAPFSGVITKKLVDLGSVVGMGTPVFEITDISQLKLTVSVPERDIQNFVLNQQVSVDVDVLPGKSFSGKVSLIGIQADKMHNFKVQVLVANANKELRSGMFATTRLVSSNSVTVLSVPRKALVGSTKNPAVYIIKDGKAALTYFTAGTSDGDFIEVINGLTKDDRIILKGQVNLTAGSPVKTLK